MCGEAPDVLVVPTAGAASQDHVGVESPAEIGDVSTQVTVETTPATPIARYAKILFFSDRTTLLLL